MRTVMAGIAAFCIAGSAVAEPGGNPHAGKSHQPGKPAHSQQKGAQSPADSSGGKGSQHKEQHANQGAKANGNGAAEQRDVGSVPGSAEKRKSQGQNGHGQQMAEQKQSPAGKPDKNPRAIRATERQESQDRKREHVLISDEKGPFRWAEARDRGLINGCPPGLAKKNNGCRPPGQAKKDAWQPLLGRSDWWGYRDWRDGVRYYDGYLLRYNGDRVASYIPLLGGALSLGSVWPDYYQPLAMPGYYQDFYGLGPSFRYADNVLYRVDPETAVIGSIAALLTGDDIVIGQPLPAYYDVYNVPYRYRDRYVDGTDSIYRYSDGYVYRVDPKTRLVQAAIELLL